MGLGGQVNTLGTFSGRGALEAVAYEGRKESDGITTLGYSGRTVTQKW
jgi:hypothetical protein